MEVTYWLAIFQAKLAFVFSKTQYLYVLPYIYEVFGYYKKVNNENKISEAIIRIILAYLLLLDKLT